MGQENLEPDALEMGLFGWGPLVGRERGRPPHVRTLQNVNKVKLLLAFGKATKQIANALGITEPTLRKHYFHELKVRDMARDALEAEIIATLWDQAEAGNVGAIKQLQARLDRADMEALARQAGGAAAQETKVKRPVAKGKKEQAVHDASDVLSAHPLLDPLRLLN